MSIANPFEVFDLPPTFAVDEQALQQRYVKLSATTHPDRFSDPLDQAEAAEKAAAINDAYRVLREPEARARALLELYGSEAPDDNAQLSPDVLMELMEVRESLEEAKAAKNEEAVAATVRQANAERKQHLDHIAELFEKAQSAEDADRAKLLGQVRDELVALRYVKRLLEQARQ